ncbi:MAG: NTPase [Symploca sp. SIO2E6]|nr:NTPase [Symploca sp. SIO2E6]
MNQNNQSINSHIEAYLDYYCGLSHPPEFAVLLKGQWGAGKTWFIKKYCEKLKKSNQKCLYVSLYGMTSFYEIEYAFFQQLHPVLSSKGMAITGKIFKGLLKGTLKIDLDSDGNNDGTLNVQIPEINLPEYLKNTDKSILIFDDLERCHIDLSSILGYINYFVEHQGLKVVIVANEDELINDTNYKAIKEKLIGKTFCMSLDLEDALKNFIKVLKDSAISDFLAANTELIQDLYNSAESQNLRILRQILLDFERIFNKLPDKAKNKPELLQDVLKLLIIFSIEIKRGKITPKDLIKLSEEFVSILTKNITSHKVLDSVTKDNNEQPTSLQTILRNYPRLNLHDPFPNQLWWTKFFDQGIIDTQELENSLSTSKYFEDENTPNWVKLWHFDDLTDDEFDTLLKKVESEYSERKVLKIEELKHMTGLFLKFSHLGLYKKTKEEILENSKSYIDHLKSNSPNEFINNSKLSFAYKSISSIGFRTYRSLGFKGEDLAEFQEFCSYIDKNTESTTVEMMPSAAQDLLATMQSDVFKFREMICSRKLQDRNVSEPIYSEIPILKQIKPAQFVDKLFCMNEKDKKYVIWALSDRYQLPFINEKLIEELEWLKSVRSLLHQEAINRKGKLSGYRLRALIEQNLNETIKNLESQKAQL